MSEILQPSGPVELLQELEIDFLQTQPDEPNQVNTPDPCDCGECIECLNLDLDDPPEEQICLECECSMYNCNCGSEEDEDWEEEDDY